ANILANEGGIANIEVLCAAILHDTIEDTNTSANELIMQFGEKITSIVLEVTDDKHLEKSERKAKQIAHIATASHEAKLVKLADKIANLRDILSNPPAKWDKQTKLNYFLWAEQVIAGTKGTNLKLEKIFQSILEQGLQAFAE
ncbi:MAG: bifunctional (p)ppGpp synthetase/guanosine-3',5'-bis(diphosphate) 3'-pyrophosphohydrolase, partial [Methylophilaceae bacterium]|nr:bifunctional (p)ppGpp synthetase/guanosine-3',5'-bis(diphosphate) 3'-pyrophosphohydrolase [Methylophilaceae bacterium]